MKAYTLYVKYRLVKSKKELEIEKKRKLDQYQLDLQEKQMSKINFKRLSPRSLGYLIHDISAELKQFREAWEVEQAPSK